MSNVSNRFTFRDGKTYLTGYPKWTGIHDLNDPVYSGYDTLYIGSWTPDQERYFIIGPTCATTYSPKLSIYDAYSNSSLDYGILPPGLTVVSLFSWGDSQITRPNDTPNILATLGQFQVQLDAEQATITPKIISVRAHQNIAFKFSDNGYQPDNEFMPMADITTLNPLPWTPTLIIPVGNFNQNSQYSISGAKLDSNSFVYVDGVEKSNEFTQNFTVPVLFEYGPRRHFQSRLTTGQNWNDTCYHFWTVNLTSSAGSN